MQTTNEEETGNRSLEAHERVAGSTLWAWLLFCFLFSNNGLVVVYDVVSHVLGLYLKDVFPSDCQL